jgi:small-conductance mechanosensitive channel
MPEWKLPEMWEQWLSAYSLWGNSASRWLSALIVLLIATFIGYLTKRILARRAARFAERTASDWDDAAVEALQRTKWWFLLIVAACCASYCLVLSDKTRQILQTATILALLLQSAVWGNVLIGAAVGRYVKRRMQDDPAGVTTVSALALLGRIVLFSMLLLLALDNLGVNVTTLIAGLGVGGIAVALAVQTVLGDLLASLSIVFDQPFVLGDFIIVGNEMGTVEKIGMKTTRIRSLSGEQLVFSNNDLLQSRIRNFKRMYERRVVFSLGVTYQTPRDKVRQIPELLRDIIQSQQQVRFDRAHFSAFGDFALVFEIVYYVLAPDYNLYMDIQQAVNLAIQEQFEARNIEFAYPTQTLFLEKSVPAS